MNGSSKQFSRTAQRLSRSPLGIIALFIVFVYFFAALVAGPFGSHLETGQKWSLLIFLITFPVLVFFCFVWLVIRHHSKLYAPHDFRSDESFLHILSTEEQRIRLDSEPLSHDMINSQVSQEDSQKQRAVDLIDVKDAKAAHLLAGEFAIRALEVEWKTSITRQVAIGSTLRRQMRYPFDGVAFKETEIVAIEVVFVDKLSSTLTALLEPRIEKARKAARYLSAEFQEAFFKPNFKVVLALVVKHLPLEDEKRFLENVEKIHAGEDFWVEFKFFEYDDLTAKFID